MNIALFGGSGRSGKYVLRELLKRDFHVKALVRKTGSLCEFNSHKNLEIIVGDALDADSVQKTIKDCQAVISTLGHRKNSPSDLVTRSIKIIIQVMQNYQIKRLICLTGAGVYVDGDKPTIMDKILTFIIKTVSPHRFKDGENMVDEVMKSDLDWTIVRTQLQLSKEKGGKESIGMVGSKGQTLKCSRGFIARFMVDSISSNDYVKKAPVISD